ncbi:MAG: TrmH family RNA methyltransferase [Chitinophagales bacterium]
MTSKNSQLCSNEITSRENPIIKYAASLHTHKAREREGKFLIEGIKLVEEAISKPGLVDSVLINRESIERVEGISQFRGQIFVISPNLNKLISDTQTPQGVWAICRKPDWGDLSILMQFEVLLLLAGIQDPGNLGTMLRTARAAGVGAVILTAGTVDVYNPKVVRAAAGTILSLPVVTGATVATVKTVKTWGFKLLACDARGDSNLYSESLLNKTIMMIGSEGSGIPQEFLNIADRRIFIPLQAEVESLNAGVACGIVLYEALRQRMQNMH